MGKVESVPWTLVGDTGMIGRETEEAVMRQASGRRSISGRWSIENLRSHCNCSRAQAASLVQDGLRNLVA